MQKMSSCKKGSFQELLIPPLISVIIVVGVFLLLLNFTNSVGKSPYFEREFVARDVGLLVEALLASPNNLQVDYPQSTYGLNITLTKSYVETFSHEVNPKISPSKASRFSIFPSKIPLPELTISPRVENEYVYPSRLYFLKAGGVIKLSGEEEKTPQKESRTCSIIYTAIENWYSTPIVYIDAIPPGASGAAKDGTQANVLLERICSYLSFRSGVYSENYCKASDLGKRISAAQRADFVIFLKIRENPDPNTVLRIYYFEKNTDASSKSKKFSCMALSKADEKYSGKIVTEEIPGQLLQSIESIAQGKPSVVIEISDISQLDKSDIEKIGEAIYESIKIYYEG